MTRTETAILAALITFGVAAALAVPELRAGSVSVESRSLSIGDVSVTDGDSLRIGDQRIRLFGVDAPEIGQTCLDGSHIPWACGVASAAALRAMVARDSWSVVCERRDTDRYGRVVAICRNSEGDFGGRLIARGLAVEYKRYSGGMYRDHEAAAKAERLGMWAGDFVMPEVYRRERKR